MIHASPAFDSPHFTPIPTPVVAPQARSISALIGSIGRFSITDVPEVATAQAAPEDQTSPGMPIYRGDSVSVLAGDQESQRASAAASSTRIDYDLSPEHGCDNYDQWQWPTHSDPNVIKAYQERKRTLSQASEASRASCPDLTSIDVKLL